jgi:N-acetylmuramoyl-L-alanine amidase
MQVFYSGNFSDQSQLIAEAIQETTAELLQTDNVRQIKECGTSVYLIYNAVKPAVLVECGFLSNHREAELLKTDDYQKKISYCIYIGLLKYSGR